MTRKTGWRKALRQRTNACSDQTDQKRVEVKERRAKRRGKAVVEEGTRSLKPNFEPKSLADVIGGDKKSGQTRKSSVNWFTVLQWFREGMDRNNPKWLVVYDESETEENQKQWIWSQKNSADRLLKRYGPEVVKTTVAWFCDNWQALKDASDGRLSGAPTVNLLWVSRERYFTDAAEKLVPRNPREKKRRLKHMVAEYDEDVAAQSPGAGWGDVNDV